ncbi:MAG TPA: M61 family peptidase [Saprospiraceae bacterium]|nr:M61 family peptidase [Saprospiraceae bacterium]
MVLIKRRNKINLLLALFIAGWGVLRAEESIRFTVSMPDPSSHRFHVRMQYEGYSIADSLEFHMPVWTPGYYQRLDFWKQVSHFKALDGLTGHALDWNQGQNVWKVSTGRTGSLVLEYEVLTLRPFVAQPWLDTARGYVLPAGLCVYPAGKIRLPVLLEVEPYGQWTTATGLKGIRGKTNTYYASDFDVLFDSPVLAGPIESLPSFRVRGVPHYFKGIQLGTFDKQKFIGDLKKIVETAVDLIGHIPYEDYTFLAIGPGAGGIEHLNNTTFSFNGNNLHDRSAYLRMLFFLAHEYFHHYNVKRIRPIELGPFDYDQGNRTHSLWWSEGASVYYEYLVVKRAGLCTEEEMLDALRKNIAAFEDKPGKAFQTLAQASWATWSDGPFGRVDDEINRTISYYDKGPVVSMLFDFRIRRMTGNQKSLDDVMRDLYYRFYLNRKRGFSEFELKQSMERVAGGRMDDLMDYVYTTRDLDYRASLAEAGLYMDDTLRQTRGGWTGMSTRRREDTLQVFSVEYESPAWKNGFRRGMKILRVNDKVGFAIEPVMPELKPGETLKIEILEEGNLSDRILVLGQKTSKSYLLKPLPKPDGLQKAIYKSWMGQGGGRKGL